MCIRDRHKTTAGLEVRALLPDATDVWVIEPKTGRKLAKLECLDSRGFFSGVIPRRKNFFRYQLAVVWHGQQNLIDDPYRFGPLIQEMDCLLYTSRPNLGCRRMARFMALVCIRWTRLFLCSVARITSLMTSAACVIKPILTTPLKLSLIHIFRVVQSINGLCKADKRQECRKNQKSFHRVSSSEDIL